MKQACVQHPSCYLRIASSKRRIQCVSMVFLHQVFVSSNHPLVQFIPVRYWSQFFGTWRPPTRLTKPGKQFSATNLGRCSPSTSQYSHPSSIILAEMRFSLLPLMLEFKTHYCTVSKLISTVPELPIVILPFSEFFIKNIIYIYNLKDTIWEKEFHVFKRSMLSRNNATGTGFSGFDGAR